MGKGEGYVCWEQVQEILTEMTVATQKGLGLYGAGSTSWLGLA